MARTKNLKVPRLIAGLDVTTLPLSPLEGFVMSRIDGVAPVHLLADLTSLDEGEVGRIVEHLIELGAAEWVRESVHLPRASVAPPARTPSAPIEVPSALRGARAVLGSADTVPAMPAASGSAPPPSTSSGSPAPEAPGSAPPPGSSPPTRPAPESPFSEAGPPASPSSAPPASDPPASDPPASDPPASTPPASTPPASDPPASTPPASTPPASDPPASTPPASSPSGSEPPSESDDLDLDPARRATIDALYDGLDQLDHYRVLGIERDATRCEVRDAYFRLSKVVHPDTMFRKRLGSYKAKMEAVFARLTEAYEVLGKKRAREEYDRYLASQDETREAEDVLERAADDEPTKEPEAEPVVVREPDPEALARQRARRAESLRRAVGVAAATRGRAPSSVPPSDPPARDEVLRSLTRSLKWTARHTGGVDPAQPHVERARRAEEAGELAEAARELRAAVALAPDRADLRAEHARIDARLLASLSDTYEQQALYEQRHGKWEAAAVSWRKVFAGRPGDARAAREAARALIEADGDLHRASRLAQRAVELAPDDVLNLRVLGRVYLAAGLRLNARRVLQRAAALDPDDEMVETLLRSLGRD